MVIYENTISNENGSNGVKGYIEYINDKNHINHREAKDKGNIHSILSVKTLDRELLKDGSCNNRGISMILPIPTCFDDKQKQVEYTNAYFNKFCNELGIDKSKLAYECVIHNHIDKYGKKNYHAHFCLITRELNTQKSLSGRKRYFKIVDGKKVRCSKKEATDFTLDKGVNKSFLHHIKVDKNFNIDGKDFYIRDLNSCYMPLVATTLEQNFIKEFDINKTIENEKNKTCPKNRTEYAYYKIGKKINGSNLGKNKDGSYKLKGAIKYLNQQFRIEFNKELKNCNIALNNLVKKGIYTQNNRAEIIIRFKRKVKEQFESINKDIDNLSKFHNVKLSHLAYNYENHKVRKYKYIVKTKTKEKTLF